MSTHNLLLHRNLTAGVLSVPPKIDIQKDAITGEVKVTGLMVTIIDLLSYILGFKYSFLDFPDGEFGQLLHCLVNKTIDFEGIGFIPDSADLDYMDYTSSALFDNYMAVILRQPSRQKFHHLDVFAKPFPLNLWLCILLVWLLTCILTTPVNSACRFVCTVIMKATLLRDLMSSNNIKSSLRTIVTTYFLMAVVIFSVYNSLLMAYVTIVAKQTKYERLEDLLQAEFHFGINKESNYYPTFKDMEYEPFKSLRREIKRDTESDIKNNDVGIKRALVEKYALIENSFDSMNLIKTICVLDLLPTKYFPSEFNIAYPNNSTVREPFSRALLKLRTTGVLKKELDKIVSLNRPDCIKDGSFEPILLMQVAGPFFVLFAGLSLTSIVFGAELVKEGNLGQLKYHSF